MIKQDQIILVSPNEFMKTVLAIYFSWHKRNFRFISTMADQDYTQPYSAPRTFDTQTAGSKFRATPAPGTFSIRKAFADGWAAFSSNIGGFLAVILITGAVLFGISIVVTLIIGLPLQFIITAISAELDSQWSAVIMIASGILQNLPVYLITFPILAGLLFYGVLAARYSKGGNLRPAIEQLFGGFKRFAPVIGIGFLRDFLLPYLIAIPLIAVVVFAGSASVFSEMITGNIDTATMPEQISSVALAALILAASIFIFLVIFISFRLTFGYQLCLDQKTGVLESLKLSWKMTSSIGVFLKLVLLYFATTLILMISFVLCLVPALFTGGLVIAIFGSVYDQLLGRILIGENHYAQQQ
jgi:hypothetical protein